MSTLNERRLAYFKNQGATSDNYNDAQKEFLLAEGQQPGHIDDMWYSYLGGFFGLTGTLQERKRAFWDAELL